MKSFLNRIVCTLTICAVASVFALGKTRRDTITLTQEVKINNTLLKSGTYEVTFNDETNELAILKNGKVVAKTTAKLEQRNTKATRTELKTVATNSGIELLGVAFSGSDKNILVDRGSDAARN